MIESRKEKLKEGKETKHIKEREGKKHWTFDIKILREISPENERIKSIKRCNKNLSRGGSTTVYYKVGKNYYWVGKKNIEEGIRKYEIFQKYKKNK